MIGFLSTVVAKLASLSVATQAAAGITIAVAGVGGVAAAGDLPAPMQNAVSSAVSAVTPLSLPHASAPAQTASTGSTDPGAEPADPSDDSGPDGDTAADTPASATPSTPPQAAFGQAVRAAATGGGVDGQAISSAARATHQPSQAAAHRPTHASAPSPSADPSAVSTARVHGKPATVGAHRP